MKHDSNGSMMPPNDDDVGDQAELDYIIEQGQLEAEQFAFWMNFNGHGAYPAKWLNPPHKIEPDHWRDFVNWHIEWLREAAP